MDAPPIPSAPLGHNEEAPGMYQKCYTGAGALP